MAFVTLSGKFVILNYVILRKLMFLLGPGAHYTSLGEAFRLATTLAQMLQALIVCLHYLCN
jgi:hypothetical protein